MKQNKFNVGDKVIYRNRIKTICQMFKDKTTNKQIIILLGEIYTDENSIKPYAEITKTEQSDRQEKNLITTL